VAKLAIFDKKGKETGSVDLPDEIFAKTVNQDVIHQAVTMYQASLRQGNASTKERNDVSGGGKKPFKQKGTGRARQGSTRSPLWHHGGVVFGPQPRDFSFSLPRKVKRAALRETLNAKYQGKDIVCIQDLKESFTKTKDFAQILKNLSLNCKVLAVLEGSDSTVERVTRNIARFNLTRLQDVTAYDVMRNKKILVSESAIKKLIDRVTK
jgi:large subunit ribosomal protein L4